MPTSAPPSRRIVYAASTAALLFAGLSNAGDMAEFATGGYARGVQTDTMMKNIDADHDGKITKAEWLAYQERVWNALDKDANGVVDEKHFLAPSVAMATFATGGYARGLQTREMMHKIDKDGDGTVSHDEYIANQAMLFDLMDTGHSGAVGPREFLDTHYFPSKR